MQAASFTGHASMKRKIKKKGQKEPTQHKNQKHEQKKKKKKEKNSNKRLGQGLLEVLAVSTFSQWGQGHAPRSCFKVAPSPGRRRKENPRGRRRSSPAHPDSRCPHSRGGHDSLLLHAFGGGLGGGRGGGGGTAGLTSTQHGHVGHEECEFCNKEG